MFGLGIYTKDRYLRMGPERRMVGPRVAYNLLRTGENPSPADIALFEDISVTLRTSNGTYRTTYRNRFEDVDLACTRNLQRFFAADAALLLEDRAVSHALTSAEWARRLFAVFPHAQLEASDLLLQLLELQVEGKGVFITEVDGTPLQYIKPPLVVSLCHPESLRNPLRCIASWYARQVFRGLNLPAGWMNSGHYNVTPIPFIHPEATALMRSDNRFRMVRRSIFERSAQPVDVIRTMNIFNRSYFSDDQLSQGFRIVHDSLKAGGIWVAGRTLEENLTNHASILRKAGDGWEVVDRVGEGWELQSLALKAAG